MNINGVVFNPVINMQWYYKEYSEIEFIAPCNFDCK